MFLGGWFTGHSQFIHQLSGRLLDKYWWFRPLKRKYPKNLDLSPNTRYLLSCGSKDRILVWDWQKQKVLQSFNSNRRMRGIRVVRFLDNERIALFYRGNLLLYHWRHNKEIRKLFSCKECRFLSLHRLSEKRLLLTVAQGSQLLFFDTEKGQSILRTELQEIYALAFNWQKKVLAVHGGRDRSATLVSQSQLVLYKLVTQKLSTEAIADSLPGQEEVLVDEMLTGSEEDTDAKEVPGKLFFGKPIYRSMIPQWADQIGFLQYSHIVYLSDHNKTYLRDWLDSKPIGFTDFRKAIADKMIFAAGARHLVAISKQQWYNSHPKIYLYDAINYRLEKTWRGHRAPITDSLLFEDKHVIFTASKDQMIGVWFSKG
ncbi:MAG: WD40 repeat domain-containing protein [Spirochaetota bacterium]